MEVFLIFTDFLFYENFLFQGNVDATLLKMKWVQGNNLEKITEKTSPKYWLLTQVAIKKTKCTTGVTHQGKTYMNVW